MTHASGFPRSPRPKPITTKAGQESVWDYPRPPRRESRTERVVVRLGGQVIADITDAVRVLETSHPPVYYLPIAAFPDGVLVPGGRTQNQPAASRRYPHASRYTPAGWSPAKSMASG